MSDTGRQQVGKVRMSFNWSERVNNLSEVFYKTVQVCKKLERVNQQSVQMSITSIPHSTCLIPSNSTYRTGVLHPSKTGSFLLPSEVHSSSMISAQCLLSSYLPMTVTSLNKGSQAFALGSSRHQRCISHILVIIFLWFHKLYFFSEVKLGASWKRSRGSSRGPRRKTLSSF